jgi:Tfp pilus assembly protein PilF
MSRLPVAAVLLLLTLPALAADPVETLIAQGRAAMQSGDADKAIDILKQAVAKAPKSAEAHMRLGEAYGQAAQKASLFSKPGLASNCREQFEAAVAADPNYLDARFALVEYYLQAPGFMGGGEDKAVAQAQEIRKRDVLQGHLAQARIYNYQKKPELAHAEYAAMIKEQPSSPKAHYFYGASLISEKKYDAALAEFETSLKLDANFMPGVFQIGHMAALTGKDMARGEESLKRYLGYKPAQDEPGHHRAHFWLGGIYEKQGKKAEAKAEYATSLKLNANQKDVQEAMKRM